MPEAAHSCFANFDQLVLDFIGIHSFMHYLDDIDVDWRSLVADLRMYGLNTIEPHDINQNKFVDVLFILFGLASQQQSEDGK